jgi:endoglucanase
MKTLVKRLTEAFGPPGYENAVRDIIQQQVTPLADSVETDALGNLHAVKKGSGNGLKIMLAAHMDEIGLMVSHIDNKGFARFTPMGYIHPATLVGSRAMFTNGALGVINVEKWPLPDDMDRSLRSLYLDFGAKGKQNVPVQVGDVAGFQRPFADLGHAWVGKSLDDRVGCAILIETLRQLKKTPHDIYFVFTVQEEVGVRGAAPAAYKVNPDVSIAVDITDSGDVPGHKHYDVKMGCGPAIKAMDNGMLAHPGLKKWMVDTARQHNVPYQIEILTLGSSDARAMQMAREGSAAGALSIPCRHLHTPSEMVNVDDVQQTIKLLLALLSGPARLE